MMLYYTRIYIFPFLLGMAYALFSMFDCFKRFICARESSYRKTFSCTVVMNVLFSAFLRCIVLFFPVQRAEYIEYSTTSKKEEKNWCKILTATFTFYLILCLDFTFLMFFPLKCFSHRLFCWIWCNLAPKITNTHHIRWGYYLQTIRSSFSIFSQNFWFFRQR